MAIVCGSGQLDQRQSFSRIIAGLCSNCSMKLLHLQQWCLLLRTPVPPVVLLHTQLQSIDLISMKDRTGNNCVNTNHLLSCCEGQRTCAGTFDFHVLQRYVLVKTYPWGGVKWEWQGCSGGGVWCPRRAPLLWDVFLIY